MAITVHETTDYDSFKFLDGNRPINEANLNRLRSSYDKYGPLTAIITVNSRREIIDGQHRFLLHKEFGLPINFIIKRDYGIREVHAYNQNTKNWTLTDFMNSYVGMGKAEYKTYKFFKEKYGFGHYECIMMLLGLSNRACGEHAERFKDGLFKIKNLRNAMCLADKILSFSDYYDGFRRRNFILAMVRLMTKVGDYDHNQMLQKLSYQSARLTDQPTVAAYLTVLEKIYNYKTRDNYVRFDLAA